MAKKVTTVLALRDNYTAVIKKARRYTSAFDKDVQKMTARLDKASKKKHDIKVKNSAAMKALNALEKKIAPMRNVMVKVAANVAHFKNQIKPVTDTIKKVTTKAWTITVKVKDTASAVLRKISSGVKKVGTIAAVGAGAALAAGGYALSKGMALEGYDVSMQHFVGVNNPNASKAQVEKQTKAYLAWLRNNANATPFGTEEVIQAGSRGVQIAEGNTKAAQGLVKMAEDMAALTPGKTVMDAMEALADANMGEFERMKEFGFKMSADEFKKSGYDLFSTKSTTGKTLVQVFGGGAEKFANTTTGMWSTITGEIESDIADIGLGMAKGLKPLLEWVRGTVLPDLEKFLFLPMKGSGKTGMETLTQGIKDVYYWLKEQIPSAIESIKAMWTGFANWFNDPNGILRQALNLLNITIPTIGTEQVDRKPNGEPLGGTKSNGKQTATGDGGSQLNLGDALTGIISLNIGSFISKVFTGKGLISNVLRFLGKGLGLVGSAGSAAAGGVSGLVSKAAASVFSWIGSKVPSLGSTLLNGAVGIGKGALSFTGPMGLYISEILGDAISNPLDAWDKVKKAGSDVGSSFWGTMGNIGGLYKWGDAKIWEGINAIYKWLYKPGESAPIPTPGPAPSPKVTPTPPPTATPYSKVTPLPTPTDTSGLEAISKMARDNADAISAANKALAAYYANIGQPPVFPGYRWNGTSPGTPKQYTHAAGIKRVPWDNYPTLLHKGETVLPSGEAGEYRGNGNQAAKVGNIFHLAFHINGGNYDVNQLASIMVGQLKEAALNME